MPYLRIEYTDNLTAFPAQQILAEVNASLAASDAIRSEFDLKSMVSALRDHKVGVSTASRGFIYAQFFLYPGRSADIRKDLAERIASVIRRLVLPPAGMRVLLSVEMIEMNQDTYQVEALG